MKKVESYQDLYYAWMLFQALRESRNPRFIELRERLRTEIEDFCGK
ncbi:MAG: hypothetical protein ACFFE8_00170 [Candidatus Heimdallarchaeota archaeon]